LASASRCYVRFELSRAARELREPFKEFVGTRRDHAPDARDERNRSGIVLPVAWEAESEICVPRGGDLGIGRRQRWGAARRRSGRACKDGLALQYEVNLAVSSMIFRLTVYNNAHNPRFQPGNPSAGRGLTGWYVTLVGTSICPVGRNGFSAHMDTYGNFVQRTLICSEQTHDFNTINVPRQERKPVILKCHNNMKERGLGPSMIL
jgi:hypothetical protein